MSQERRQLLRGALRDLHLHLSLLVSEGQRDGSLLGLDLLHGGLRHAPSEPGGQRRGQALGLRFPRLRGKRGSDEAFGGFK